MSPAKRKSNFMMQASILAAAGILVRIIGMLYRVPLTNIIGDEGNGYYSTAYNIYTVILLISSYSIPIAISKLVSGKLVLKQYKNAHRIFICSMTYVMVIGGVASIATFIFAPFLVAKNPNSVLALRILAPAIFFSGILGVLRGYMQAHNTMVPTSISQILEQILNAMVSVLAAWILTRPYVAAENSVLLPKYGAAGGAMGTGAGVFIGLAFMLFVYLLNAKGIKRRTARDQTSEVESYKVIFRLIILMVTPVIFSTFVYNISTSLDMTIFYWIMDIKGMDEQMASSLYGVFSTKYMVLINVPVALANAVSTTMIPGVSSNYTMGDIDEANRKISLAIRFTMVISIPAAIGMGVLARPIMQLLFPQPETLDQAVSLLSIGCISVVFYALSTVSNGILQGIGKVGIPLRNATITLVIHTIALLPMLYILDLSLYGLLFATMLYSFLMCVLNSFSVKKYLNYHQDIKKTFLIPGISAGIMGIVTFFSYRGVYILVKSNVISMAISVFLAVLIYFVLIIKLKGVEKEELRGFPGGTHLIRLGTAIKLL